MTRLLSTLILSAVLALPALADTADVKTGTTVITFSDTVATALDLAEVAFKKAQPARINPGKGALTYVASGGAIDLSNGKTEIIHSGGITLGKGESTVTLLDPIIELSEAGVDPAVARISAILVVNGVSKGRAHVFNISGTVFANTPVQVPNNNKISANDLELTLTSDAATELNTAFGVTVFDTVTVVGTADINLKLASSTL